MGKASMKNEKKKIALKKTNVYDGLIGDFIYIYITFGSTEHYDQRTNYTDIDVRLFIETNK